MMRKLNAFFDSNMIFWSAVAMTLWPPHYTGKQFESSSRGTFKKRKRGRRRDQKSCIHLGFFGDDADMRNNS